MPSPYLSVDFVHKLILPEKGGGGTCLFCHPAERLILHQLYGLNFEAYPMEKRVERQYAAKRNEIEGAFRTGKRKYGMDRIRTPLAQTNQNVISLQLLSDESGAWFSGFSFFQNVPYSRFVQSVISIGRLASPSYVFWSIF